ncbi:MULTISPECIES: hypothetical protein [Nocardia]|jgi:hypothetical protein|uniref:Uncharacterized protein n=2 Tax=Nocardia TaxID=1817 RepID=U5E6K1_NOCAS|nr:MULTISPECIES: hypothetical protein [Nocardia]TLF67656.1 hypothetical protein FEK33_17225 [Nocardia asteroides NBRC 15531]UGT50839.1 hypothetical protein LT345_10005 [Nocardia asteroides]SFN47559.1 hypothetical protein SAMN05444423_109248 [Nocardia asteroides]VEG36317.1 Uncharacterised protein [Nocardia asteroides]GAD85522.1 hypothetical protein NCAST_32_00040 [Nocardia asteroides NBRC 15531]
MTYDDVSERSYEPLTEAHLRRLAELAHEDHVELMRHYPHLRVFRDRVLLTALCQGGALHWIDGENGVKDLDVFTFYAKHPEQKYPPRRRKTGDFGLSELGRHPEDIGKSGRRVDFLGKDLDCPIDTDPVEAVRSYLRGRRTNTAKHLAEKAVVVIAPDHLLGQVIWPE